MFCSFLLLSFFNGYRNIQEIMVCLDIFITATLYMSFSRFTFRLKYIRIFFVMSYIYIMFKFKSCIYIPNNTFFDIVNVKTIFFKFNFFLHKAFGVLPKISLSHDQGCGIAKKLPILFAFSIMYCFRP